MTPAAMTPAPTRLKINPTTLSHLMIRPPSHARRATGMLRISCETERGLCVANKAHKIPRGLVSEGRDIDVPRGETLPIPLKSHGAVVGYDVMYARRHSCVADGAVKIP